MGIEFNYCRCEDYAQDFIGGRWYCAKCLPQPPLSTKESESEPQQQKNPDKPESEDSK